MVVPDVEKTEMKQKSIYEVEVANDYITITLILAIICLIIGSVFIILINGVSKSNELQNTSYEVVYVKEKTNQLKYDYAGTNVVAYDFAYIDTNGDLRVVNNYRKTRNTKVADIIGKTENLKTEYEIDNKGYKTLYVKHDDIHKEQKVVEYKEDK